MSLDRLSLACILVLALSLSPVAPSSAEDQNRAPLVGQVQALLEAAGGVPKDVVMTLRSPGEDARSATITFEDFKGILEAMDPKGAQATATDGWPKLGFGAYVKNPYTQCTSAAQIYVLYLGSREASIVTADRAPMDIFERMVCALLGPTKTWTEVTLDPQAPGVSTLVGACAGAQVWVAPTPSLGSWFCGNEVLRARGDGILASFAFGPHLLDVFWGTATTIEVGPLA